MSLSRSLIAFVLLCTCASTCFSEVYELRTYTTNDGKLENLNARFRDHTVALFEKHGMESVGYWVPTDGEESKNTLIYVLKHASRDAAKKSWKAFMGDPDWQAAYKASIAEGRLVNKVESVYMNATDYSPSFETNEPDSDAVYELRVYTTNEGKLDGLNARFRDNTIRLFERHGIESVAYWVPADEPASENTLIYVIRHSSRDAAKESWRAFGRDAEWQKVATESQKDGKFLSQRPESTYMKATDYSALQ